jgi:hypothetical protein
MTRQEARFAGRKNSNILSFVPSSAPPSGARAIDLVYQAAEVFSDIEDNAREIEARAQAMCKSAADRLRHAEQRAESAESSLRQVVADADGKLHDASRSLAHAELRITVAEDKATAAEIRAHVAEAEAREAKQMLALVEDAIRRRLLCANPEGAGKLRQTA